MSAEAGVRGAVGSLVLGFGEWRLGRLPQAAPTSSVRRTRTTRRSTAPGRPGPAKPILPRQPAASRPRQFFERGRRPPADRLHPVHRQHTDRPAALGPTFRSATCAPSASISRPASRSTRRRRRQCTARAAKRPPRTARPSSGSKVGTSEVTATSSAHLGTASRCRCHGRRLQHRPRRRANPPASASACSATTSSSKPTSPGRATTTSTSRSTRTNSNWPVDPGWETLRGSRKTASSSTATRRGRHLHHDADHLPRAGDARLAVRARVLDLPAGRLLRGAQPELPQRLVDFVESKIPRNPRIRNLAEKCDDDPLRSLDRRRPEHAPDRLPGGRDRHRQPAGDQKPDERRRKPGDLARAGRRKVTLPAGMGLNPSAANGLAGLHRRPVRQGRRGTRSPARRRRGSARSRSTRRRCPTARSAVRSTSASSSARDPASGNLYRIFVVAESARYDISARLLGKVSADPQTGQLTTTFDDARARQHPDPGPAAGAVRVVPDQTERWRESGADQPADLRPEHDDHPDDALVLARAPSADPTKARRPIRLPLRRRLLAGRFARWRRLPENAGRASLRAGFAAGTNKAKAGAFSPLRMNIARSDGNQELKGVDVDPAARDQREAGRRPLLPAGGARGGRGQ